VDSLIRSTSCYGGQHRRPTTMRPGEQPVDLAGGLWPVLICYERKVLLAGCWWPICSDGWFVLRDNNYWLVDDKAKEYGEVVLSTRPRRTRTTGPSIEARRRRPPDMAPARPNGRPDHGFRWPSAPVAGQMPCLRPAATRPTGPRVPAMAPRQLEQIDDDAACCVPPSSFCAPALAPPRTNVTRSVSAIRLDG
jgi:hypothetical protein